MTPPRRADWIEAVVAFTAVAVLLAPIGFATGLLRYEPRALVLLPAVAVQIFFVPVLGEEAALRGALPSRAETPRALLPIAISTALFVLWHVVETAFLSRAALLFLRPEFLFSAGVLGLACAMLRWRSGSLWTAVAIHWVVVVIWQQWLGGPGFEALR